MNYRVALISGVITGLGATLGMHGQLGTVYSQALGWTWLESFYTLAVILTWVALLLPGVLAVLLARGHMLTLRQGGGLGLLAGLICGAIVALLVLPLTATLTLGVVPLIVPLAHGEGTGTATAQVLRPVVSSAITGVYLMLLQTLLIPILAGGLGGVGGVLLRNWTQYRRSATAASTP